MASTPMDVDSPAPTRPVNGVNGTGGSGASAKLSEVISLYRPTKVCISISSSPPFVFE